MIMNDYEKAVPVLCMVSNRDTDWNNFKFILKTKLCQHLAFEKQTTKRADSETDLQHFSLEWATRYLKVTTFSVYQIKLDLEALQCHQKWWGLRMETTCHTN